MNRKKWQSACLIALAFLYSCNSDPYDDTEFPGGTASSKFTSKEARAYFERTAEDLRSVSFRDIHPAQTKSIVSTGPELREVFTPLWNKLRQTDENDVCVTVEVPLDNRGGPLLGWCESHARNGSGDKVSPTPVASSLVIKKNTRTGEIFYFVATFIPDPACAEKRKDWKHPYRFMMDRDYSGYVLISEVTGKYVTAFLHRGGSHHQVHLRFPGDGQPADSADVVDRLRLATTTPAAAMPMAAAARSSDSEQGGSTTYCAYCGSAIQGSYCTNPNCKPVEVTGCKTCHSQFCKCCRICQNYPCKCTGPSQTCTNPNCPYGGYCNGLCSSGGGGEGGGTSGGGGSGGGGGGGGTGAGTTSWQPGQPYPGVPTTVLRWKNLFAAFQPTLDFLLVHVNSVIVQGRLAVRDLPSATKVAYVTKDPSSSLNVWVMDLNPALIPQGTFAEQLIMIHELYHLHLFLKAGVKTPQASHNDTHHAEMVSGTDYTEWLKKAFPGRSDTDYDLMRYVGTTESPIFTNARSKKQSQVLKFFQKNNIVY